MKKKKLYGWAAFILIVLPVHGYTWDDSPDCFKRFERNFFKEQYLDETFAMHGTDITQSSWNAIYVALQQQMQQVPGIIKSKAAKMDVNPLDHPFQHEVAEQLLFEVLYAVFVQVMHDYNVKDPYAIQDMFNYIRQKQEAEIDACFTPPQPPQKKPVRKAAPTP